MKLGCRKNTLECPVCGISIEKGHTNDHYINEHYNEIEEFRRA